MKSSYSKIQREFLEKFDRWLKDEFAGEQLAIAERIGCDKSLISRWVSRENAPPEYVCRLLLEKMGGDRFKKTFGPRIQYLREKVFKISLREFAWAFGLESISQLESIERGETELPRPCLETLIRDFLVSPAFLDYGEGGVFTEISHSVTNLVAYLRDGFDLFAFTPPKRHVHRLGLTCRLVLHRKKERLPQCFVTATPGSLRPLTGGRIILEDAIWATLEAFAPSVKMFPAIMTDEKRWANLEKSCFYEKNILFYPGCIDQQSCTRLRGLLDSVYDRFKAQEEAEKHESRLRESKKKSTSEPSMQTPSI